MIPTNAHFSCLRKKSFVFFFTFYLFSVLVCGHVYAYQTQEKGQLSGISSRLLPCESLWSNWGCQAWWQTPLPIKPFRWPLNFLFKPYLDIISLLLDTNSFGPGTKMHFTKGFIVLQVSSCLLSTFLEAWHSKHESWPDSCAPSLGIRALHLLCFMKRPLYLLAPPEQACQWV